MKVKHYIYSDPRKNNDELKAWFAENFETPEAIEASITSDTITLEAKTGPVEIQYIEVTNPFIFEGHTFEELVEYHVEYTIGDKVFSSKIVNIPWGQKRIVEVAVVHYATANTKVSRQAAPKVTSKAREERELLKSLKAKSKNA